MSRFSSKVKLNIISLEMESANSLSFTVLGNLVQVSLWETLVTMGIFSIGLQCQDRIFLLATGSRYVIVNGPLDTR